jgi:hypothetical protein
MLDITTAVQPLLPSNCAFARHALETIQGTNVEAKLWLLLDSHEESTTDSREERLRKKRAEGRRETLAKKEVDRIARGYMVQVWRKRASLFGGVPSLDNRSYKMVLGALRPDGRCASFVDVKHRVEELSVIANNVNCMESRECGTHGCFSPQCEKRLYSVTLPISVVATADSV